MPGDHGDGFEHGAPIRIEEFKTLNRCLDNAIADAVTEFSYQRDVAASDTRLRSFNEQLGFLAHELRNHIQTATFAVAAIRAGNVGFGGATGAVLDRSLVGMRSLIDRSLADVRTTAGLPPRVHLTSLADFIAEIAVAVALEAKARGCRLSVAKVEPALAVDVDRDLLLSAVGNLLQNAFKFTKPATSVSLNAYAIGDRIRIDVADHCGGLPPGDVERMFVPFAQTGVDKSGLGLGLSICRRSVEANKGSLGVRDIPGVGCVFSIDLPRHAIA